LNSAHQRDNKYQLFANASDPYADMPGSWPSTIEDGYVLCGSGKGCQKAKNALTRGASVGEAVYLGTTYCFRHGGECGDYAEETVATGMLLGAGAATGVAIGEGFATEAEGELGLVCHSFDPTTEVVMADGSLKKIADVKVGDRVRATDPSTEKPVVRTVTALHRNHDTDLADLVVGDGDSNESVLHTTQHHRFWDDTRQGWVEAAALTPGHRLHTDDGDLATVDAVHTFDGQQWMYDLTVDDVHT
jgi:hypothetical protein